MPVFKFKKFKVNDDKSAMKVGTDAVLIGSWATCENLISVLDIGTGTGIIALMLAQRNPLAKITGIEINKESSDEAKSNIYNSRWKNRINIINTSLQKFDSKQKFDLIVSNPPFFHKNALDDVRSVSRHTNKLSFKELLQKSSKLLSRKGVISVIIPEMEKENFTNELLENEFYINRICSIKGNSNSKVKRLMIELSFRKSIILKESLIIEKTRHIYTQRYIDLCKEFYLKM